MNFSCGIISLALLTAGSVYGQSRSSGVSFPGMPGGGGAPLPLVKPRPQFRRATKSERKVEMVYSNDGKEVDSILAAVNDQPISLTDVMLESAAVEARMSLVYNEKDLQKEILKVRSTVLEDIIARKLILMDYEKEPFEIPKQYIEQVLDDLSLSFGCASREELAVKARKSGMTMEELRLQAKNKVIMQIMVNRYYQVHVNITPRELYEYYEKNRKAFSTPSTTRLQLLLLKRDKKDIDKLVKEISDDLKDRNPRIFHSLTVLHSDGPNPGKGGDVGWIEDSKLRGEFADAISSIKKSGIVGPVKTPEGIYFIRVVERKPGKKADYDTLNRELKKKIESRMKQDAYRKYIDKLKKDAIIRYCK